MGGIKVNQVRIGIIGLGTIGFLYESLGIKGLALSHAMKLSTWTYWA